MIEPRTINLRAANQFSNTLKAALQLASGTFDAKAFQEAPPESLLKYLFVFIIAQL